jgi:hypothetical protein
MQTSLAFCIESSKGVAGAIIRVFKLRVMPEEIDFSYSDSPGKSS